MFIFAEIFFYTDYTFGTMFLPVQTKVEKTNVDSSAKNQSGENGENEENKENKEKEESSSAPPRRRSTRREN